MSYTRKYKLLSFLLSAFFSKNLYFAVETYRHFHVAFVDKYKAYKWKNFWGYK